MVCQTHMCELICFPTSLAVAVDVLMSRRTLWNQLLKKRKSYFYHFFFYIKSAKREFVTVSWTVIDANDIWSTTVTVCVYLVLWDSEKRKPRITCMFSKGFFQGAWVVFEDNIINIEGLFLGKKIPVFERWLYSHEVWKVLHQKMFIKIVLLLLNI